MPPCKSSPRRIFCFIVARPNQLCGATPGAGGGGNPANRRTDSTVIPTVINNLVRILFVIIPLYSSSFPFACLQCGHGIPRHFDLHILRDPNLDAVVFETHNRTVD